MSKLAIPRGTFVFVGDGDRKAKALIVVAPPRTPADLRSAFHDDVKNRTIAEIDRDLTHRPVYEIEKHLVG